MKRMYSEIHIVYQLLLGPEVNEEPQAELGTLSTTLCMCGDLKTDLSWPEAEVGILLCMF